MASSTQKNDNGKVLKWIIFPSLFISFIGLFIIPELRLAFALYFGMSIWSVNAYRQKEYQEEIYGIKQGFLEFIFIKYPAGIIGGIFFLFISSLIPAFSLLTPTLSLSVAEDIRGFIIIIMAPYIEEPWRAATLGYLRDIYKISFAKANVIQSLGFGAIHVLVYGLAFGAYDKWVDVYGGFAAISGSLAAAVVFGLISGYVMERKKDITYSLAGHQTINFWLFNEGLVAVA